MKRTGRGWLVLAVIVVGCQADLVPVGDADDVIYSAETRFGGFDRIQILRVDPVNHTCARLSMRSSDAGYYYFDVAAPTAWIVEFARLYPDVDCLGGDYVASAVAGTGFVEFPADYDPLVQVVPCTVDVDATFELDTDSPEMLTFTAAGIAVEGSGC